MIESLLAFISSAGFVTTLATMAILSFLVLIHELGHYLTARWAKVEIEEFGIGLPPRAKALFTFDKTIFSLNWIPLGGYVRMAGEELDPEKAEEQLKNKNNPNQLGPFFTKPAWKRLIIITAGAGVNFLFGVLVFAYIFTQIGIPEKIDGARIGYVEPESPAETAGLKTDYTITSITDGEEVTPITDITTAQEIIRAKSGKTISFTVVGPCQDNSCPNNPQVIESYVRTQDELTDPALQGLLGIGFQQYFAAFYPLPEQIVRGVATGFLQAFEMSAAILNALSAMVVDGVTRGKAPTELTSIVGIVDQASDQGLVYQGPLMMLNFAALLSVNLAIINLLPLPALDGGRVVFIILEQFLSRKRLSQVEQQLHYYGIIALLGFMGIIMLKDIWKLLIQ